MMCIKNTNIKEVILEMFCMIDVSENVGPEEGAGGTAAAYRAA